jgi:hypothetical protein
MEAQGPLAGIARQLARYPLGSYANSPSAVLNPVNRIRAANTRPETANRRQPNRKGSGVRSFLETRNPAVGKPGPNHDTMETLAIWFPSETPPFPSPATPWSPPAGRDGECD